MHCTNAIWFCCCFFFRSTSIEDVGVLNTTEILPRVADVTVAIEHDPPCLRGECYPWRFRIINNEKKPIFNVRISISSSEGRIYDQPKIDSNCASFLELSCGSLDTNCTGDWMSFFTQMEQAGTHNVTFQVLFRLIFGILMVQTIVVMCFFYRLIIW